MASPMRAKYTGSLPPENAFGPSSLRTGSRNPGRKIASPAGLADTASLPLGDTRLAGFPMRHDPGVLMSKSGRQLFLSLPKPLFRIRFEQVPLTEFLTEVLIITPKSFV